MSEIVIFDKNGKVVVFSGTKARSEKLKIKPKVSSAMLETIEYFENRE